MRSDQSTFETIRSAADTHPALLVTSFSSIALSGPEALLESRALPSAPDTRDISQTTSHTQLQFLHTRQDSAAAEGGHGGRRTIPTTPAQRRAFRIAHGTLMGTAFTIVLPLGAILLRTLPSRYRVPVHAGTQLSAYTMILTGMGLGIWLGRRVRYLDYAHTVIGLVVISMLAAQAALGAWTHARFRVNRREGWMGLTHTWLGRTLLALGIINGGIGLMLADNTTGGEIAYGVVAGLMGTAYIAVVTWWIRDRIAEAEKEGPGGEMMEMRGDSL